MRRQTDHVATDAISRYVGMTKSTEYTFSVSLHICDSAKGSKVLPELSIRHVLRYVAHVYITVVRVSPVHSGVVQAVYTLLVLRPATPHSPAHTSPFTSAYILVTRSLVGRLDAPMKPLLITL